MDVYLPISDAQRDVWLVSLIDDEVSRTYNEPRLVRMRGALDTATLEKALQFVVGRHDALRVTFSEDGTTQRVSGIVTIEMPIESIREAELDERLQEITAEPFDLRRGPLVRFRLFDLGTDQWALLLVAHHAIVDGWSWAVILDELGGIYGAFAAGTEPESRTRPDYSDYVAWLGSDRHVARAEHDEAYWLERLADIPEEVELPSDRPRPAQKTYVSGRIERELDAGLLARIKSAARDLDCTVFQLLAATYYVWLYRVTGVNDLVVAVPTAGQMAAGVKELRDADRLVGHCENTLPMRMQCVADQTFRAFLQRARSCFCDGRDHQHVSISNLLNKLHWPRDPSRLPLASVSLNFASDHQVEFPGLVTKTSLPTKTYNFYDLTTDLIQGDETFTIDCKYNVDLFDPTTVERWLQQWELLLGSAIDSPDSTIGELNMLNAAESKLLLETWNATRRDYSRTECLQELIEEQVRREPGRQAAVSGDTTLTYAELDQRANQFAHSIRARGIGRGQRVGICLDRDADMLAAVLGILKSGAGYVPLDPSFPDDRLRFMEEDSELALLISTAGLARSSTLSRDRQLLLDEDAAAIDAQRGDALTADATLDARPEDPAYLIYTSGSTGKPKGVVVPHRAAVNFLTSMADEPGLSQNDVLVAVTTLSFDISVLELYLPLIVGATVVIAGRDDSVDGETLVALLEDNGATAMQATAVTWRLLLQSGWTGKDDFKALVGGEPLPRDLADSLIANDVQLWNMYGPTETTVWSTCARIVSTTDGITIGTPIANTTIYILDEQRNVCPVGVPGELFIGGDGVALGYWKRPELTADRFVDDPFGTSASGKIYATGDKARWLANGTLEHLGRLDDQVKVRGYRVELGEIEACIVQHPSVSEAAVCLWSVSNDDVRIVASFVPENGKRLGAANLRKHLRTSLPEYMMPQYLLPVEEIPLMPNGKVDRRRLPTPATAESAIGQQEPPANQTESAIADIWTQLIQPARPIGRNDMFFEMGGHSLLALHALRLMADELGLKLDFQSLLQENLAGIASRFEAIPDDEEIAWIAAPPM
jgi:amino acid adenylation domain-containing protein